MGPKRQSRTHLGPVPSSAALKTGQFLNRHRNSATPDSAPQTFRTKRINNQGTVWPSYFLDLPSQPQMHVSP